MKPNTLRLPALRHAALGALAIAALFATGAARADSSVTVKLVGPDGPGATIGHVMLADTPAGLQFTPMLTGLPPGPHGFHVHANGSCDTTTSPEGKPVPAGAAGGHFDPEGHKAHAGPGGMGHMGDLPVLDVDPDGRASKPVVAPRLKLAEVAGKAIVIHAGGDNYADQPAPLGGGGARLACGLIP